MRGGAVSVPLTSCMAVAGAALARVLAWRHGDAEAPLAQHGQRCYNAHSSTREEGH